jgi:hypothetical protein
VKGKVSLTCDAWQASNSNGYFAVTGSWIEEVNGKWQIKPALLGFTQLNNAHNGMWLGQALFKIVSHVGIAHKVGLLRLQLYIKETDNTLEQDQVCYSAITPRTTIPCFKSLPCIFRHILVGTLIQRQIVFGNYLVNCTMLSHPHR